MAPHPRICPPGPRLPPLPTPPLDRPPAGPGVLLRGLLAGMLAVLVSASLAADIGASARDIERQFRNGEQQLALQQLDQALVARPADPGLRFLRAVLLTETGRSAEAVPVLERMTEDFPDLPAPYNNLAA